jgi:hydroxymethylpyrimidine/phosphomethylpyrimidine kinase
MRTALTIAGSDSGGGAGIQADLKTFAAHGVYGTTAITAITAQNTRGVIAWEPVSTALIVAQIDAVAGDIGVDAVKTGMLATEEIVTAVANAIGRLNLPHLVVDPVMVAKGGDRLLEPSAIAAIRVQLLPLAHVVTPNIPEAEVLTQMGITSVNDMREAARRILALGPRVVVVKGGHLSSSDSIDVVCTTDGCDELASPRIYTSHTHGTGCTFASAIAANIALGHDVFPAVERAKHYVDAAIRAAPRIGGGHGPLGHFPSALY